MSNEELCKAIQNGKRVLLSELIEQNKRILHRVARYYMPAAMRNKGADMDDLTQAAALGMIEAVNAWDESRGCFLTIAVPYMRKEVMQLLGLRSSKQRIENAESIISLQTQTPWDDELQLIDTVEDTEATDPQEAACTENMRRIVREAVQTLPQEQREAVTAFYLQGKPAGSINKRQRQKGLDRLSRTSRMQGLIAEYHAHAERYGGMHSFRQTHTSAVEWAVIERERIAREIHRIGIERQPYSRQSSR